MATTIKGGNTTISIDGSLRISNDVNNSIDSTQGDWSFVEGEENLYLVNNKNSKKYKINLTEVS